MMDPRVFRLFSFVTVSSTVLMFPTRTQLVAVSRDPIFHSCFCFCATTCDIMTLVSIATLCDGQFLLSGPNGSFSSSIHQYNSSSFCRWIIKYIYTHTHMDSGLFSRLSLKHCPQGGCRTFYSDQLPEV